MTGPSPSCGADRAVATSHGGPAPDTGTVKPDPAAPKYTPFDATAPKVLDGHDPRHRPRRRGEADDRRPDAEGGFVQAVWTFNGTVPVRSSASTWATRSGSTSRTRRPASCPHSVDFHASQVAWNDEMTSINPGEEKLYEWTADYAGVWMYHCGTAPGAPPHRQRHVRHGHRRAEGRLRAGRPRVRARPERVVPRRRRASRSTLTKAAAGNPAPDFVVFNGVAGPVPGQPDPGRDRQEGPHLRPRRRPEHRQLVPHRRHDLQHRRQGGRRT